jgi:glycosyltransferase involved in cell wall biosynthesis
MNDGSGANDGEVDLPDLDVALAHWHVDAWGGGEYLVTKLAEALGVPRVYTMGPPDPDAPNPFGPVDFVDVTGSLSLRPLRRLQSRVGRVFEYALWEDVDWRDYGGPDVLVTSGATTRAVITPDDTLHVNYCHSPPRWFYDRYHDRKDSVRGQVARPLVRYLRTRDAALDARVDHYLVNSPIIRRRLWKFYKRESTVLYPPLDLSAYDSAESEGFYLHLGRLDTEKGIEAVVDAFVGTDRRLVLAGGRGDVNERTRRAIRGSDTIDYVGFVSDERKYDLLARCRAVVFNGRNEDFGIVPVEANASGKACLVPDEGFPGLYVEEGINGFVHDGSAGGIQRAVERLEREGLRGDPMRDLARFSEDAFVRDLRSFVAACVDEFGRFTR